MNVLISTPADCEVRGVISVFAGGERQTLWNSPKTCCGLWWTRYERGQCPKMVHNVYEWANRCSWRWEIRATLWIARRPSGTRREYVNWCHGTTSASVSEVTMWRSRWRCVIKAAYSVSFPLSINTFVWQNVLYFLDAPHSYSIQFIILFGYCWSS